MRFEFVRVGLSGAFDVGRRREWVRAWVRRLATEEGEFGMVVRETESVVDAFAGPWRVVVAKHDVEVTLRPRTQADGPVGEERLSAWREVRELMSEFLRAERGEDEKVSVLTVGVGVGCELEPEVLYGGLAELARVDGWTTDDVTGDCCWFQVVSRDLAAGEPGARVDIRANAVGEAGERRLLVSGSSVMLMVDLEQAGFGGALKALEDKGEELALDVRIVATDVGDLGGEE